MRSTLILCALAASADALATDIPVGATEVMIDRCMYHEVTAQHLSGLDEESAGLTIRLRRDGEDLAVYTSAGGTIEGIDTVGTYAGPSADSVRFAEIGSTGCYQLQFEDAIFTSGSEILMTITGATDLLDYAEVISLKSGWDVICEAGNSPALTCADIMRLLLAEALGEGAGASDGSSWTISTPDGNAQRAVITYGADPGDRTIAITP